MLEVLQAILNFITAILTGILNLIVSIGEGVYNGVLWIINSIILVLEFLLETAGSIMQFFGNLILQILNGIITFVGGLIAFVLAFFSTIINFIVALIQNIIEVIRIVALIIDIIVPIAQRVFSWIGQGLQLIGQIVTGVNNAPPTAIPGLPRCVSAPLESQICAVWYIGDWTLFAPNTPGAFIIPILVLLIDLFIIVYVVRSVFKLVRWFQSLYQVA
jgi:hypothetical protein